MTHADLQAAIEGAWSESESITPATAGRVREAVEAAVAGLDAGRLRVAEPDGGSWVVNEWLKKAVLLSFRLGDSQTIPGGPGGSSWWDKVPSKLAGWGEEQFGAAGFRSVLRTAPANWG
jgi:2,3,4,5-tetrahydropyridine-2-carboxylate N-succinyltransferase